MNTSKSSMYVASKNITDDEIIAMIEANRPVGWEHLYDKYSLAMYSFIYKLAKNNKAIAEKIFINAFLQLKESRQLPGTNTGLCLFLLKHSLDSAKQQFNQMNVAPAKISPLAGIQLLRLLRAENLSVQTAARMLSLTEEQVKEKLHEEVKYLRKDFKNIINQKHPCIK